MQAYSLPHRVTVAATRWPHRKIVRLFTFIHYLPAMALRNPDRGLNGCSGPKRGISTRCPVRAEGSGSLPLPSVEVVTPLKISGLLKRDVSMFLARNNIKRQVQHHILPSLPKQKTAVSKRNGVLFRLNKQHNTPEPDLMTRHKIMHLGTRMRQRGLNQPLKWSWRRCRRTYALKEHWKMSLECANEAEVFPSMSSCPMMKRFKNLALMQLNISLFCPLSLWRQCN